MGSNDELWATLRAETSAVGVDWLRTRLAQSGLLDLTASELAVTANITRDEAQILLERLVAIGLLTRRVATTCPCCREELTKEELATAAGACPHCERAFGDCGAGPEECVHYLREGESGRSVPWVLVLHGMNTRGGWQEELSWLIATTYGRSVPVFIYKYGRVVTGVLLGWRRRWLIRKLARRIEQLAGQRQEDRLGARPDVIAHSFGTWMLGHALASADPELADLKVGRVVLLGSILRPTFEWSDVLKRGRAEAILNHYGSADRWAGIGGYIIYDAGPSGRRGFDHTNLDKERLINREQPGFGHSSFFETDRMRQIYRESWKPFLTRPLSQLRGLEQNRRLTPWRPPPRALRFAAALTALMLVAGAAVLTVTALMLGLIKLASTLMG